MLGPGQRDALTQQAMLAMQAGRDGEAERLWQQLAAAEPDNAQALLHLGQRALQRKDPRTARSYLDRARAASPRDPVIPLNQSFLFRQLGDVDGEMAALTAALEIDPYFYPALLAQGMLQERAGNPRAAAITYRNVLKIAPPRDRLPEPVRASLDRAEELVRKDAEALNAFLEARLEKTRAAHPNADFTRMEHCKDLLTGRRRIYVPEPAMLQVPYVPPLQFYDGALFPWLADVEAATGIMREEFLAVFREDNREGFRPYIERPAGVPLNQWAELNKSPRWSVFSFWANGVLVEANCARCPKTVEVLSRVPKCEIANFAPNVLFSLLAPRTTIPSHCGDTNARLIVHLPLIVPDGCRFRVGNETREWKVGKAWVFDDTVEHEAVNDSDDLRVIVMIDVWNPYLAPEERETVAALLNATNEYRAGGRDAHGG